MNIELKNVKEARFASRETACFSASVYIDGVNMGTVENDGQGGADRYSTAALEDALNAHAATLPARELWGKTMPMTADAIIAQLMDAYSSTKQLKRTCATKTVFRLPGETYADGEYLVVKNKFTPEVRAAVIKRHGEGVVFLNETI